MTETELAGSFSRIGEDTSDDFVGKCEGIALEARRGRRGWRGVEREKEIER